MPDYEQVDTEIFATEQEPVEEEEVVEKPKRVLSEKQIDALARGRAKVAENRKRKLLLKKKKDEDFVKQAIEEKIANRVEKRAKLKSEREQSKREKLLEKKKQAQAKQQMEEQKAREVGNSQKIENWVKEREKALDNCETIEEFDELSGHLDSITEEDILDNKKLHTKLNKIYALYKV